MTKDPKPPRPQPSLVDEFTICLLAGMSPGEAKEVVEEEGRT